MSDTLFRTLPTVTQLLDLLSKPALLKWANKLGLEGVNLEDYQGKSKADGNNTHKLIENDLKHGITYDNEAFQKFKSRYEIIKVEPVIECEHYTGRADVMMKRDGKLWLFDFKNAKGVYFEQKLQLIAYKRIMACDMMGIVNTDYFTETIVDVPEHHEQHYIKIISALTVIWHSKKVVG